MITLNILNSLSEKEARTHLEKCCVSKTWISNMVESRPFSSEEDVFSVKKKTYTKPPNMRIDTAIIMTIISPLLFICEWGVWDILMFARDSEDKPLPLVDISIDLFLT